MALNLEITSSMVKLAFVDVWLSDMEEIMWQLSHWVVIHTGISQF
jgi:hypothetical protein